MTENKQTLLQKLKKLAFETEDHKEIVSDLLTQEHSDSIDEPRNNITTNPP